jgi:hypothetical protein
LTPGALRTVLNARRRDELWRQRAHDFIVQGDLGHEADTMTRHYSREERHLRGHVKDWPADGQLYIRRPPPPPAGDHLPSVSAGER